MSDPPEGTRARGEQYPVPVNKAKHGPANWPPIRNWGPQVG